MADRRVKECVSPAGRLDRVYEMRGSELAAILLMVVGEEAMEDIPGNYRARIWSIGRRGPDIERVAVAIERYPDSRPEGE